MKMVIGGAFQGKKAFAKALLNTESPVIADGETCVPEELYSADIVYNFHMLVRRMMEKDVDPAMLAEKMVKQNPKIIVVTNELGYGVVPMDPVDRAWREMCGRICTLLAAQSEQVYRVVCGIGTGLKA